MMARRACFVVGSRPLERNNPKASKEKNTSAACPRRWLPGSFQGRDGKHSLLAGVPGQTGGCSGNHFVAEQLLVWGAGRRGRGVLSARFASHTLGDMIG